MVNKATAELDLTGFGSPDGFEDLLARHELESVGLEVKSEIGGTEFKYYRWEGENVCLWSTRNPITGQHAPRPVDHVDPKPGFASYLFVEGEKEAARELYLDIFDSADYIKGEIKSLRTDDGRLLASMTSEGRSVVGDC